MVVEGGVLCRRTGRQEQCCMRLCKPDARLLTLHMLAVPTTDVATSSMIVLLMLA